MIRYFALLGLMGMLAIGCTNDTNDPQTAQGVNGKFYYSLAGNTHAVDLKTNATEKVINEAISVQIENGKVLAIEGAQDRMVWTNMTGTSRQTIIDHDYTIPHRSYFNSARLSPNGQYIAYDNSVYSGNVYVIDAESGALVATIGDQNEWYNMGDWAPDGSLLLERWGDAEGLYLVDPTFQTKTRIDPENTRPYRPTVSKQGIVAFTAGGGAELWTMNLDGTNPTRIVADLYKSGHALWSPDGNYVAISSDDNLRVIKVADGSSTVYEGWYLPPDSRNDWEN